mgnify:CR=1 FL=1
MLQQAGKKRKGGVSISFNTNAKKKKVAKAPVFNPIFQQDDASDEEVEAKTTASAPGSSLVASPASSTQAETLKLSAGEPEKESAVKEEEVETDRLVIDRLADFVVRHGENFEKMTKEKNPDNPKFAFLFRPESDAYKYYEFKKKQVGNQIANERCGATPAPRAPGVAIPPPGVGDYIPPPLGITLPPNVPPNHPAV